MLKQKIKHHRIGSEYSQPHFFILSKGRNSGKPLSTFCPNCFVFLAESETEKQQFYYLCDALWQSNYFHSILVGSVIEFVRINDFVTSLNQANKAVEVNNSAFNELVSSFQKMDALQKNLKNQLFLIEQLKKSLVHKLLKTSTNEHDFCKM